VLTWDLEKNMENQMSQVKGITSKNQKEAFITRGMSQKYNYVITETNFYDLQFGLPMNMITDIEAANQKQSQSN
jgi:hypothetical protein